MIRRIRETGPVLHIECGRTVRNGECCGARYEYTKIDDDPKALVKRATVWTKKPTAEKPKERGRKR